MNYTGLKFETSDCRGTVKIEILEHIDNNIKWSTQVNDKKARTYSGKILSEDSQHISFGYLNKRGNSYISESVRL